MGSETMPPLAPEKPALSKRQRRRQGSHPSTKWQQQPRIKSASARAKAYITYAGLSEAANGRANQSKDLDPKLDLHSPEVKFGRMLGSTDQRKRHQAVQMLQSYLRARSDHGGEGISALDLLKLWKGLWYTLYMCDKVAVQDRLSEILAETMWCLAGTEEDDEYAGQVYLQMSGDDFLDGDGECCLDDEDEFDGMQGEELDEEAEDLIDRDIQKYMDEEMDSDDDDDYKVLSVDEVEEEDMIEDMIEEESAENEKHCRGAHLVSLYIATFLKTIRREWGNVDKHRVDKFYTSVRLMLSEAYKYMAKRYWNMGIVRLFNDVLYEEALSRTPNGLRYHIIDICVEELAKVNKDASVPLTEATFLDCLEPFFAMIQRVEDKNVQKRVVDNVMMKFLNEYSFVSDVALNEVDEDEAANELIFSQVHVGTVAKFIFEIASDGDTDVRYRKCLYEMHKTFVRKIRSTGRDVEIDNCSQVDTGGAEVEQSVAKEEKPAPVSSSKKDKKKKKKNNKDKQENEDVDPLTAVPEQQTGDSDSTRKSAKKKRKNKEADVATLSPVATPELASDDSTPATNSSKKKKRMNNDIEATVATPAPKSNDIEASESVIKSSSKKKRKKDTSTEIMHSEGEINSKHSTSEKPPLPTASKKKKKKQKSTGRVEPELVINSDGDVLAHKIDLSLNSSDADVQNNTMSASKRVSFGARNQSKSHKASMKALKTLTPKVWSTANRTPDKSILLKRPDTEVKQTKSKKKKRRST